MSAWINRRIDKFKRSLSDFTFAKNTKTELLHANKDVVAANKDRRTNLWRDRNKKDANRDYFKFCERVIDEQNDCAWRCAHDGHMAKRRGSAQMKNARKCMLSCD